MAKNRKKDVALNISYVIAVTLCIIAIVGGFVFSASQSLHYNLEKSFIVEVSSVDDMAVLGDSIYNDELVLMKDITISDSDFAIGTAERPFKGKFNGNGHTVRCAFSSYEDIHSIFGCIAKEGEVSNTNFVFESLNVDVNTFAGIAQINYGVVKNCRISFECLTVNNSKGVYAAGVVINNGTITNVVSDCKISTGGNQIQEKLIKFGAIAAYNYGTVKNCIALPVYEGFECTDEFTILIGDTVNLGVSAICAETVGDGKTANNAILLKSGVFTLDKVATEYVSTDRSEIFNEKTIFDDLDFDNRIWGINGDELTFIIGSV